MKRAPSRDLDVAARRGYAAAQPPPSRKRSVANSRSYCAIPTPHAPPSPRPKRTPPARSRVRLDQGLRGKFGAWRGALLVEGEAGLVEVEVGLVEVEVGLVDAEVGLVEAEAGLLAGEAGLVKAES